MASVDRKSVRKSIMPYLHYKNISDKEIFELREAFRKFETKEGMINPESIMKMLYDLDEFSEDNNVVRIIEYLNTKVDENGYVNFEQFLDGYVAVLCKNSTDHHLKEIFNLFKEDGEEFITLDSFRNTLDILGEEITENELRTVFESNTGFHNHILTFHDFKKIFLN